jgi:uncharacterized protein (DUF1330 family)
MISHCEVCSNLDDHVVGFGDRSHQHTKENQLMKLNYRVALAALAGVAIGVAGGAALRAQQVKTPPGYLIAEVDVTDPVTFQKYADQVPGTLAPFNGRYLVRGGKTVSLEGEAPKRFVVIAFESVTKAQAWEDSPAYSAIKPIRQSSAKSRLFIAEGVTPQ